MKVKKYDRLYNASFKRLPNPDGLRYLFCNSSPGKDDEGEVTSLFLASIEFKEHYAEDVSNESNVNTFWINVLGKEANVGGVNDWLGRDCDQAGYDYRSGKLNNGVEPKYELLLGFSKSAKKDFF